MPQTIILANNPSSLLLLWGSLYLFSNMFRSLPTIGHSRNEKQCRKVQTSIHLKYRVTSSHGRTNLKRDVLFTWLSSEVVSLFCIRPLQSMCNTGGPLSFRMLHKCTLFFQCNLFRVLSGCKMNNINVVYTPWANLKKTGDMDVGQIGFYRQKEVSVSTSRFLLEAIRTMNIVCPQSGLEDPSLSSGSLVGLAFALLSCPRLVRRRMLQKEKLCPLASWCETTDITLTVAGKQ